MSFINTVGNIQGDIGGVTNALNTILGQFAQDVVGVYDEDSYEQIWQTSRPIKVNVNPQQQIMQHPIESGAIRSDFAIVLPVELEMSMILGGDEYAAMYQQIKAYFLAQQTVIVQTRADVFTNMLIQAMPHEENADMYDVLPLALKLREVQLFTTQYQALSSSQVANPTDQSTVNSGQQQPQTPGSSVLSDAVNYVKGLF